MNRMQKHNLYNIKRNFEKKTGTRLISAGSKEDKAFTETAAPRKRLPRVALIAAIITVFVTLTAFAVSIFSTWAGDSLTITASYYGDGIVWVEVTNQSDKDLKLQPKMKLYYYSTQKLVESTDEEPYIDNLTIPAHSTEKVRLDLRRTYDVEALENSKNDFYYLQMTNDSFLLGQKWSCMVSFVVSDYVTPWYQLSDESHLDGVLPSLKAYFKNFTPDVFARWTDVFDYVELVQAELAKVEGKLVRACDPPINTDLYNWLGSTPWSTFDGYNKLLGIDDSEYYDMIGVDMPCIQDDGSGSGGGWIMPLFYLYQYCKADISSPQDYVFMSGNLLTFEEIEPYKVYENSEYVIYEMHHGIVSDQANERFSPMELKLMRHSLIAFERMMYGPGKRGSHNPSKAAKSAVNVGLQDDGQPILCYTAAGKPYNIPQFHRHRNEATIAVPNEYADGEKQIRSFLASLERFSDKYTFLSSEHIPDGDILVGFSDGIYYVATNSVKPSNSSIEREVKSFLANFEMQEIKYGEHYAKQSHRMGENSEVARMYAKIALNVLALRKGSEYASHPNFSEIREWILTGKSSQEFFFLPQIQVEPPDDIMKMIPPKAHWCIFVCGDGKLDAIVCLYNRYIRRFTLGNLPEGKSFLLDGYICDWVNEQEYTIMQFVEMIARAHHDEI